MKKGSHSGGSCSALDRAHNLLKDSMTTQLALRSVTENNPGDKTFITAVFRRMRMRLKSRSRAAGDRCYGKPGLNQSFQIVQTDTLLQLSNEAHRVRATLLSL